MRLVGIEAELETQRIVQDTGYSLTRHVDVLIAIVGEAQDLRAVQAGPQLV